MRKRRTYRDLVIFFGISVFPIAHFLLQDYPNTAFYLGLLTLSLLCVFLLKHYHKDWEFPFDFDENLNIKSWGWIILGTAGIYSVTAVFTQVSVPANQFSPFVIPMSGYSIRYLNVLELPTYMNDVLFNLTVIATGEELCKLVSMTVLYIYVASYTKTKEWRYGLSVGPTTFFWSTLHAYSNPYYIGNPIFVVSAFISGLILVGVLWKTKSILAAILSHGLFNSLIIFLAATQASLQPPQTLLALLPAVGTLGIGGLALGGSGMHVLAMSDVLVPLKDAMEGISSVIVTGLINFVSVVTGGAVNIPPWIVQLGLFIMVFFSFWKWMKRLPLLILIILGFTGLCFLMDLLSV